jgi:hypothetical protein
MKIVVLIVRLLLGLVFFVFGLNTFLQFLKGPIPWRPRRTISSGSIPVALWVGDRRSGGGWRRAAADQYSINASETLAAHRPVIFLSFSG